jgi:hypothetical protein
MSQTPIARLSLVFLMAGAAGNLIDRAWQGFVVDFLHFIPSGTTFPYSMSRMSASMSARADGHLAAVHVQGTELPMRKKREQPPVPKNPGHDGTGEETGLVEESELMEETVRTATRSVDEPEMVKTPTPWRKPN